MKYFLLAVLCSFGLATAAASQPKLSKMIDNSIGYTNVRPGVLLIETETGGYFCKIDINDDGFAAYAAKQGNTGAGSICIPYDVFDANFVSHGDRRKFSRMIDESEGYESLRPEILMIETEEGSFFCQVSITDATFSAYAANGASGLRDSDAAAICIPAEEFNN